MLVEVWHDICPRRPSCAQLLSHRVRWILENGKLSKAKLNTNKSCIWPTNSIPQEETGTIRSVSGNDITIHEEEQELPEFDWLLKGNLIRYSGVAPEKRPTLMRLRFSKNMEELVRNLNEIIPE
ncbi:hypothetical protein HHI36_009967 [Cryptolaemus montrouzieri]|uniref:Uncharacterized protein n=1 Tax=Cryptolaemus montrouzieri TaxID=559131 RepID=A0ABD2MI22_9CUCU